MNIKYLVIEIQKSSEGVLSNFTWAYDDYNAALSKYYTVLSSAAISQVFLHAAAVLNETGREVKSEHFYHVPESQQEPEPEEQ